MLSFRLSQAAPSGGDCTAPYYVYFDKECTVEEFINEVLTVTSEWGYISVWNGKSTGIFSKPVIEYNHGSIIMPEQNNTPWVDICATYPENYMKAKIIRATASGGWSRMDYNLYIDVEEPPKEKTSQELAKDRILSDIETKTKDDILKFSKEEFYYENSY